jgi:hypothetical protein
MAACYFSESKFQGTIDEFRSPNAGMLNIAGNTGTIDI